MDYQNYEEDPGYSDDPDSESEQQMYNEFYHKLTSQSEATSPKTEDNSTSSCQPSSNQSKCSSSLNGQKEQPRNKSQNTFKPNVIKCQPTKSKNNKISQNGGLPVKKDKENRSKKLTAKMNDKKPSPIYIDLTSQSSENENQDPKKSYNKVEQVYIDLTPESESEEVTPERTSRKRFASTQSSSSEDEEIQFVKKMRLKGPNNKNNNSVRLHTVSNSINLSTSTKLNSLIKKQKLVNNIEGSDEVLLNDSSDEELEDIMNKMSDDRSLWEVSRKDFYSSPKHAPICDNCNTRGHIKRYCPKPIKIPRCSLCGKVRHRSEDCPNPVCFYCNSPGHWEFQCLWKIRSSGATCTLCKMTGHFQQECPDLWRRYHSTVEEGPIVELSTEDLDSEVPISCYNCGSQDHFGYSCKRKHSNKSASLTWPYICSYETPSAQLKTVTKKQVKEYQNKLKVIKRSNVRHLNSCLKSSNKIVSSQKEPNFPRNNLKRPKTALKEGTKTNKKKYRPNLNRTF